MLSSNNDDKIDSVSEIKDWVLVDDILGKFFQIHQLMSKQCISKDNRKIGHSYPVSHSTGKTSDILWQEFELSHIVDSIPLFF